ncbi:uncharacterized protein RCC_03968 [Ramularia collo-cygni]|uniref:Uncharacterized protein n=1 Tax=Ramularia collo-cygni TaxID=112498 RepID=A0A2D3UT73_9PEZI|nr:uncharacterized protein RCC_03968 [Ramularia collo-cygni]CZT18128.1 uncharacterized protein RCC_03968 [Ramularia collo-cygni]
MLCISDIESVDVIVTTYHTLLAERKKHLSSPSLLYGVHWRRIILDEAHDIRDHRSATCEAICALEATCRWAITGTPIQNRILDLLSLFQFLRIQLSIQEPSLQAFVALLVKQYGQSDATLRLRRFLRCVMLRRSLSTITLPERRDNVRFLEFNSAEIEWYNQLKQRAWDSLALNPASGSRGCTMMTMFTHLRMVCNLGLLHQAHMVGESERSAGVWDAMSAQESFNYLVASGMAACKRCNLSTVSTGTDLTPPLLFPCGWLVCGSCQNGETCHCPDSGHQKHVAHSVSTLSSSRKGREVVKSIVGRTMPTKIKALLSDLKQHVDEEKCIVLSFWTSTLDVVEQALKERGTSCIRFDGTVEQKKRSKDLERFHSEPTIRVALLTISCGAVGLDLTAASRAYLMEPQWNPSVEQQALARVHRMGQTRPVTTIRYIMRNTVEDRVLQVQQEKRMLSELLLAESKQIPACSHEDMLKSML